MNDLKVIVIGAGSTGLLLAQGLKQVTTLISIVSYAVLTRYVANGGYIGMILNAPFSSVKSTQPMKHDRENGGMSLHWGAPFISKCLPPELQEKLNEGICCDPFYGKKDLSLPHYNGKTGEKIFDMPGHEPRRISRRKLRNYLSQGIDVQYGKKFASISEGDDGTVVAHFADGTTASGSLIVGCDGSNSIVREALVGKEKAQVEDLDIQMFNISCSFSPKTAELQRMGHPIFKNSYHPDQGTMWWQSIQDVQDPDRPETWLFQNIISWIGPPRAEDFPDQASRLAFWKSKATKFADPWRTVGLELPETLSFGTDRTTVWRPDMDWSEASFGHRLTLAGDAAHTMPPHRGQGLNNALEDAAELTDELAAVKKGEKSISEAVLAFEKSMKGRTLTEIPISIMQAQMVHNWNTLMSAPFIQMGANKYKADQAAKNAPIEVATDAKVI